jgi:transposase
MADNIPTASMLLYTDVWQSHRGSHPRRATVSHGVHEWARDDHGDGQRQVHCNTCEGAGAGLRTYLRAFTGIHKRHVHLYVAMYEAMGVAKRVTSELIRRMCVGDLSMPTG